MDELDLRRFAVFSVLAVFGVFVVFVVGAGAGCQAPADDCASGSCGGDMMVEQSLADSSAPPTCTPACAGMTPFCNPQHRCVACLADGDCGAGQVCALGLCVAGCASDDGCRKGGESLSCCGKQCVDTQSDGANCGGCGMACAPQNGIGVCTAGTCQLMGCTGAFDNCDQNAANGCETNTRIDPANCQKCGTACAFANGIAGCADGCYLKACQFGWDNCDGDDMNGCERSVTGDASNCGGCNVKCSGVAHAKGSCVVGACLNSCDQGYSDCDGNPANGCELPTSADSNNCGSCGHVCPQGLVCVNSSCTCPNCQIPNSHTACVNNQCVLDSCFPNYGNCDGDPKNGCESDFTSDSNNCAGCGNVCPQNAAHCINGQCQNIDVSNVFNQYNSEGRTVYIFKTGPCQPLDQLTNFCQARGMAWWKARSQQDAQMLVTNAFNLDMYHTWIQVYGAVTNGPQSMVDNYKVTVDGAGGPSVNMGFAAFRKWASSFCDPTQNGSVSCCWDGQSHKYDWVVCEA